MSRAYAESIRKDAHDRAVVDFGEHEITKEGPNQWLFMRPKGDPQAWCYWMRIIRAQGMIMAYGDAGEIIILPSAKDAFGWLKGVLGRENYSLGYVAEKVPARQDIEEYQIEILAGHLAYEEKDAKECLAELEDAPDDDHDKSLYMRELEYIAEIRASDSYRDGLSLRGAEHVFYEEWYEIRSRLNLDTSEPPNVSGLRWHFIFQVEMFRVFFQKLREADRDENAGGHSGGPPGAGVESGPVPS